VGESLDELVAACRGPSSVGQMDSQAVPRLTSKDAINQNLGAPPSYHSKKMSGAGYDVVVDVDEEVSMLSQVLVP
jgi:hypothetical protein